MSSSRGGALRYPGSTRWSSTRSRSRSDVHPIPLALAGNGFRIRAFGDDTEARLSRTASMTSLTVSRCVRIVGMTELTGSCLLKLLIVPLYEGSRAQATVKGKFFATHIDVRSTNQSCCKAVFTANSRSSVTLREIRYARPIAPQTDASVPSRGHGRDRQGRKTVREASRVWCRFLLCEGWRLSPSITRSSSVSARRRWRWITFRSIGRCMPPASRSARMTAPVRHRCGDGCCRPRSNPPSGTVSQGIARRIENPQPPSDA